MFLNIFPIFFSVFFFRILEFYISGLFFLHIFSFLITFLRRNPSTGYETNLINFSHSVKCLLIKSLSARLKRVISLFKITIHLLSWRSSSRGALWAAPLLQKKQPVPHILFPSFYVKCCLSVHSCDKWIIAQESHIDIRKIV